MNHKNSRRFVGILLGLAACGLAIQACSGDSPAGTTTTTGGDGGAPTATSTATTATSSTGGAGGASGTSTTVGVGGAGGATSSASGSSSVSTGAGGGSGCTETTLAAFEEYTLGNDKYATYESVASPDQGDPAANDRLFFELYGSNVNAKFNGELKGTFDLSAGGDSNYGTCSRCLFLVEDFSGMNRYFFQQSGSLVIDATSDQLNGTINATLSNVTLIEVEVDPMGSTTPVPNGACRHVAAAAITVAPVVTLK